MRFIDKLPAQEEMHRKIDIFLEEGWDESSGRYNTIGYKDRRAGPLKSALKTQLIAEQEGFCCYCMRRLSDGETTTLEHIVPQSANEARDIEPYLRFELIKDNVVLQPLFEASASKQAAPPYPHTVAYENLTASCNGQLPTSPNPRTAQACNNKRLNAEIIPLFYIKTIEEEIEYLPGGLVSHPEDAVNNSIQVLGLNYRTLQEIRHIWRCLAELEWEAIRTADSHDARLQLLTLALSSSARFQSLTTYLSDTYWNTLMEYAWFYSYYRSKKRG